jgi:muramoyltetrapeptide carboxypeptidase LdcA involved in peptidoglycan recycling
VKAIIAAIGGDHSCHLLPLLDFGLIRDHPKIFMGYSDITVLNVAIWKETELVTFNGPTLLPEFAEYPKMFEYTERAMLRALTEAEPIGLIEPAPWWTEEFLDWEQKKDLTRPRKRQPSPGWTWLKNGTAEGVLIGGCLSSLEHLRGTGYWPDWQAAILFFETSEEKPPPEKVDSILMDYENMGVLDKLRGLVVGRPMDYTGAEKEQLREVILERTSRYAFPVITDMDFGHTAPQFTIPVGCRARIDTDRQRFEIIDAAVT